MFMILKEFLDAQFRNFLSITSGYITPEMFGAVGDGVTDDTQAFNNAVNYALAHNKIVKLSKLYYLGSKVTVERTSDKKRFLTIEGTAVFGTNNSGFKEGSMNIIAPNGFHVKEYVKLINVGFMDYGITIDNGVRDRIEGCVFNYCPTAIKFINTMPDDGWRGEVFIDNCMFSECTIGIDTSLSTTNGFYKDSRIKDCVVIEGTTFFTGRISTWMIYGNHIYSTYAIRDAIISNSIIDNNYFDTNNLAISCEVLGQVSFTNNLFFKWNVTTVEGNHLPVCQFIGTSDATVKFENNNCTKNYTHEDEFFVVASGGVKIAYSGNVSKIKFLNKVNCQEVYKHDSNLIVMPSHANRTELISSGTIDKSIIVLSFDSWDENTIETIGPYLKAKNIPFTVFLGYTDANIGNITTQMVKTYHKIVSDYGGEVQMYTGQPGETYRWGDNYVNQYTQFMEVYNNFLSWGFGKPRYVSLANNYHTSIMDKILEEKGIKFARTTEEGDYSSGLNEKSLYFPTFPIQGSNFAQGNWRALDSQSKYNEHKPKFIMTHGLVADDTGDSTFISEVHLKQLIDELDSYRTTYGYEFMTMGQFWDYIHFPKNASVGQECLIWEGDNKQHKYVKTETGWNELTV